MTNKELIQYAMAAYGYIIKRDTTLTFKEWADQISKVYDINVPRNKLVYNTLCKVEGKIIRNINGDIKLE